MVGPEVKGPQSRQRDEFVAFAQVRYWPFADAVVGDSCGSFRG